MDKKQDMIQGWIDKAEHDLGMAELALKHQPEFKDMICFHCQQAAEKYLKALFIYLDIPFKKTHSLFAGFTSRSKFRNNRIIYFC